jgi:hypothetical protein
MNMAQDMRRNGWRNQAEEGSLHSVVKCLSEFTSFEQGLIGKKANASIAPTGETENAEYSVHFMMSTLTS